MNPQIRELLLSGKALYRLPPWSAAFYNENITSYLNVEVSCTEPSLFSKCSLYKYTLQHYFVINHVKSYMAKDPWACTIKLFTLVIHFLLSGNPYWRGMINTVDLLELTSWYQLLFTLTILFTFITKQTSYLNEEVDCTEPSPSVSIPCLQ